jgi:hypothetical protein
MSLNYMYVLILYDKSLLSHEFKFLHKVNYNHLIIY